MTVYLNLRRCHFTAILSGEKTVEYRDATPYYDNKFIGKDIEYIHFRNGYSRVAPEMTVEVLAITRYDDGYEIELGRIVSCCNTHSIAS
jgi:hypothetical protein